MQQVYSITVGFSPTFYVDPSTYFCMVRWQNYIITTLLTTYYSVFYFVMLGGSAWRLMEVYSNRHDTVDPRLLPSGNPFKYHVEALSLQPMKQFIITTMLDVVLPGTLFLCCFCFLSGVPAWRLMQVYSITVGFSPVLYCWDPMLLPSGNPFKCREEVLYLQPIIPPKCFDIFPPDWGMFRRSRRVQIFL